MRFAPIALLVFALVCGGVEAASSSQRFIVSHIHRMPVSSTALASVGYSKHLHALEIEFRNGAIYRYLEVPAQTYQDLLAAPSKAAYYDTYVRKRYRSLHVKASNEIRRKLNSSG